MRIIIIVLLLSFVRCKNTSYGSDVIAMDWRHTTKQSRLNDCGPACLKMIFDSFGFEDTLTLEELKKEMSPDIKGVSMYALKQQALQKGLSVNAFKINKNSIMVIKKPIITYLNFKHFIVLDSIDRHHYIYVRDPMRGRCKIQMDDFFKHTNGLSLSFEK